MCTKYRNSKVAFESESDPLRPQPNHSGLRVGRRRLLIYAEGDMIHVRSLTDDR